MDTRDLITFAPLRVTDYLSEEHCNKYFHVDKTSARSRSLLYGRTPPL
jgi:hypothetical protein